MTGNIAYCTLLAVAVAAYCGVSWITLLFGAAILTVIAMLELRQYRPHLAAVGHAELLHTAAMAGAANGLLASVAAYAVGFAVRLVVGS